MNGRIVGILAFALITGCGDGGSGGTPAGPSRFLYASANQGPNEFIAGIYGFSVDPGGALSPVPGSPGQTSDGGGPIAITRDSKFLYTTYYSNELVASQIHADGSLTPVALPSMSLSDTPVGLAAHPTADFLYVSGESGTLTVFNVDPATGVLSETSSVNLGSAFVTQPAVITPDGQYLYQGDSYPDDLFPTAQHIAGFSINAATGALSPVPGSPLSPAIQSGSYPTQMAVDPTGKFLYVSYNFFVVNVGADGGLAAYSIDSTSGALTAVPGSPFDVGGVPNSVAIDASGKFLIVTIGPRLGGAPVNCLAVLSVDPGTGTLSQVAGSPFGPMQSCSFVAADPTEPYVYVGSALEHENTLATVSVFTLDQASGALAVVGATTIPGNLGVSFLAVTH